MSLFKRFKEPVFLKNSNALEDEITYLKSLNCKNKEISHQIEVLSKILQNEENILNELKNSHIPMYVLHDINLNYAGFKGSIDYLIVTRNNIYLIDSKSLYGDIKIDKKDNFIKTYTFKDKEYQEVTRPIEKIKQLLEVIKVSGYTDKKMLDKLVYDQIFYTFCKPIIVVGSYKAILDDTKACSTTKDKVVRIDRLIDYIKKNDQNSSNRFTDREMVNIAKNLLNKHLDEIVLYDIKYKDYLEKDDKAYKALKKYRYYIATKENKKPSMIFSDKVLEKLLNTHPKTKEELLKIKNLDKKIVTKYGNRIVEILKNN